MSVLMRSVIYCYLLQEIIFREIVYNSEGDSVLSTKFDKTISKKSSAVNFYNTKKHNMLIRLDIKCNVLIVKKT